jgi:hypothetical protein
MRLTAQLQATGGNTTGFRIPDEFVSSLGGGGRPKVVVTVQGYQYRSSIAKMGGEYWLGVSAERRTAAGVSAGDVLELDIVLDTQERTVNVPEDLALALAAEPAAQATWDKLAPSHRKAHVDAVLGAKAAETRARRIAKSVETLACGKPR